MNPIPLLSDRDPEAPLAWRHGVPVSARQFLADVARFAPELEAGGPVINLCVDRYAFAVSLAAALVRGETPDLGLLDADRLRTIPFYSLREPAVRMVAGWYQFLDAIGR